MWLAFTELVLVQRIEVIGCYAFTKKHDELLSIFRVFLPIKKSSIQLHSFYQFTEIERAYFGKPQGIVFFYQGTELTEHLQLPEALTGVTAETQ